jgi:hypothetical protein
MAIYKAVVENNYAVIPNETLQDQSLTFEAKGILCLLLSLPADWEIHKSWLQKQAPSCGRDKLTRILGELQNAGYLRRKAKQDESGKMGGVDWYVYPTAQLENRSTENPSLGIPATTKETVLQNKHHTNLGAPAGDALIKTEQPKPKKKTKAEQLIEKVRSKQELTCLNSVGEEVLSEWARLRTSKKASSTDRALSTIEKALAELWYQHKIHPQQAIEAQCDAGWATIKVEYLANKGANNSNGWESTGPGWSAGLADEMGWGK